MNTNAICPINGNSVCSIKRSQVITVRSIDEWGSRLASGRQSGKLMVVEFTASGCSYCKFMEPIVEEFALKYSHAEFINIDMTSPSKGFLELAGNFGLKGYPTFVLMKGGKAVDQVVGTNKEDLRKKIEQHARILIFTPSSMDEWKALLRASKEANKLMVVSFKGGCTSCAQMHTALEKFANKYTDVQFVKIDLPPEKQVSMALVKEFKVGKCPTVVLVKNEKQVDVVVGLYEEQLMSKIEKYKVVEQSSSKIVWLRSTDEWRVLLKACRERNMLMVVGFTTSWCRQCKIIEPVVEQFASKYRDVKFVKVDMTSPAKGFSDLAGQFDVCAYPSFILLKNEKQVDKVVGPNADQLMSKIEKYKVDEESGKIVWLRSIDEWRVLLKACRERKMLMVVGFTTSWCRQCKMMEPVIEEFASKYRDVKFVKVDMTSPAKGFPELSGQFDVCAYPSFILVKNEKQVDKLAAANKEELMKKIQNHKDFESDSEDEDDEDDDDDDDDVPSQVVTPRTLDEWNSQVKASTVANRLMVVGFTKPNDQQSKLTEQVIEEFAKKYKDVKFVKFGMASPPRGMDLAGQFQVRACPTIILIKKGKQVDKVVGPTNKDDLLMKIVKHKIQCGCEWK